MAERILVTPARPVRAHVRGLIECDAYIVGDGIAVFVPLSSLGRPVRIGDEVVIPTQPGGAR